MLKNQTNNQKNLPFIKKSKNYKLFVVLIIISVIFMSFTRSPKLLLIKDVFNFLFMPSQERLSNFLSSTKIKGDKFFDFFEIYKENYLLREKIQKYENLLLDYDILKSENKELIKILELNENVQYDLINAKVIGRTIDDWYTAVIIDKGKNDGIEIGQTAIIGNKEMAVLVGQVFEVFEKYSKVILITSIRSNAVAFITNANQYGVIQGENTSILKMKYVDSITNIKKSDIVVTSGFGGVFPAGIYIGKVIDVIEGKFGEFSTVFVKPEDEIFNLIYVSIIKNK